MKITSMNDLFIHQVKDLLHAEKQLVDAIPKMAEAAHSEELRKAFEEHLLQTEEHVDRLELILKNLGESGSTHRCQAMEGLVKEGGEAIRQGDAADGSVRDAAMIAAAQRIEHYEIAGYGCARAFAELLGLENAAEALQQTLDEEGAANKRLTSIAEGEVNPRAMKHTTSHSS